MSLSNNSVTNLLIGLFSYSPDNCQGERLTIAINALRKQYDAIFGNAHMVMGRLARRPQKYFTQSPLFVESATYGTVQGTR